MIFAQPIRQLPASARIGRERVDQRGKLRLRLRVCGCGGPHQSPPLSAVFAQEPASALFVLGRRLAGTEATDAVEQLLVLAKSLVVAERRERHQAGGLDVVVVRLVENDLSRALLQFRRVERMEGGSGDLPDLAQFVLVAQELLEQRSRRGVGGEQAQGLSPGVVVWRL